MLDTGLVDRNNQIGFEVDRAVYDALAQNGQLLSAGARVRRDASGRTHWLRVGFVTARLCDPATGVTVGPTVRCLVLRNFSSVPNRVGVAFFHRLTGCRVVWDLDARLWCVEYP